MEMATGLFALLGVAVGGLITWRLQASRIAYDEKTRFDTQRLDAYADLENATTLLYVRLRRSEPFEYVDQDLYDRWRRAVSRVTLLCTPQTAVWLGEYGKTLGIAIERGAPLDDEFSRVLAEFQIELVQALRGELVGR